MSDSELTANQVELTQRAGRRIAEILSKEPTGTVLRIGVAGGGCSGFSYQYNLVRESASADDLVLKKAGATVLIDKLSLEFMGGATIDYVDDLVGQAFKIDNPNTLASCGCGNSFTV